jgi:hypothetical protein
MPVQARRKKSEEVADDEEIIMIGTDKQIAYANNIKSNLIANLNGWLSQPGMAKHAERINAVISKIGVIENSAWIIEHKDATNKEIIVAVESL